MRETCEVKGLVQKQEVGRLKTDGSWFGKRWRHETQIMFRMRTRKHETPRTKPLKTRSCNRRNRRNRYDTKRIEKTFQRLKCEKCARKDVCVKTWKREANLEGIWKTKRKRIFLLEETQEASSESMGKQEVTRSLRRTGDKTGKERRNEGTSRAKHGKRAETKDRWTNFQTVFNPSLHSPHISVHAAFDLWCLQVKNSTSLEQLE